MDKQKKEIDGQQIFEIALIIFLIVTSIWFIIIPFIKADQYFTDLEYNTVIRQIEIRSGSRGVPHILTNSDWRQLEMDELKMVDYIQPGDSIVKQKGSEKITVFRHNQDGSITEKEFE